MVGRSRLGRPRCLRRFGTAGGGGSRAAQRRARAPQRAIRQAARTAGRLDALDSVRTFDVGRWATGDTRCRSNPRRVPRRARAGGRGGRLGPPGAG